MSNVHPMNPELAVAAIDSYREVGDAMAITFRAWNAFANDYEMRTVVGRSARAYTSDGTVSVYGGVNGATWARHYSLDDVLAVGATTAGDVIRGLRVGDRVYVQKYGATYGGRVMETRKTQVRVRFTLRSGTAREIMVNALDLVPEWGRTRV